MSLDNNQKSLHQMATK